MLISGVAWRKGIRDEDKEKYDKLVTTGEEKMDATTGLMVKQYKASTGDLSIKELGDLKALLDLGNPTFVPPGDLKKIEQELTNRQDPTWIAAQERKAKERKDRQAATEERLLTQGKKKLGGDGDRWQDRKARIEGWWKALKAREAKETWASAFEANRMSARQIGSTQTMGGKFTVRNKFDRENPSRDREICLDRGASGIQERMKPENFYHPKTGASQKDAKGLHDLSASLLDGTKTPMSILAQLKPYKDSIVVFVPVPTEDDMQIFNAIVNLTEPDRELLGTIRSSMTRMKFAQGSDMHTTLVDVSLSADAPPKIRYGVTGRTQRKGEEEVMADETDLAARRTNALEHSVILKEGAVQKVNEIVMAYRSYASSLFPLFAKWDADTRRFNVLDKDWAPTGAYVTDGGEWHGA